MLNRGSLCDDAQHQVLQYAAAKQSLFNAAPRLLVKRVTELNRQKKDNAKKGNFSNRIRPSELPNTVRYLKICPAFFKESRHRCIVQK